MKNEPENYIFQPIPGNRPEQIVGREGEMISFMQGLREPPGSRALYIVS